MLLKTRAGYPAAALKNQDPVRKRLELRGRWGKTITI
jgi:hypothetical protein